MDMKIDVCKNYDPDTIFYRFKVIEFPISFVGLSTSQELDLQVNLNKSAYLKTLCGGKLMKIEDAREISASHKAFIVTKKNEHTLSITYKPTSDCTSIMHQCRQLGKRFVFDMRLIKIDGVRCCNNEFHSEIGRYYICGQYQHCQISHSPKVIDFGDVPFKNVVRKKIRIRNDSQNIEATVYYVKVAGFELSPAFFNIPPGSSKLIIVTLKAANYKMANRLSFQIRNSHDTSEKPSTKTTTDENYIPYKIQVISRILVSSKKTVAEPESLHKLLYQQNPVYAYIGAQVTEQKKRRTAAAGYIEVCKTFGLKKKSSEELYAQNNLFWYDPSTTTSPGDDFCAKHIKKLSAFDLFGVLFQPYVIDFGKIGTNTYGEHVMRIMNNTNYDINIKFHKNQRVFFTKDKLELLKIKLKTMSNINIALFCYGNKEGIYSETLKYTIDNSFSQEHSYAYTVANPICEIQDDVLKFGMVCTEFFTVSTPVRIQNKFDIAIDYRWEEPHEDVPFKIIPVSGRIPKRSTQICEFFFTFTTIKSKTQSLMFHGNTLYPEHTVSVEATVVTKKTSVKFLQSQVHFKDIALNIESVKWVNLENTSREYVPFYIVEPLLPGMRVKPMNGILYPKSILTFLIYLKVPCLIEFTVDVVLKINNKEQVVLNVYGNVAEPKIVITPKNISMPRVPSCLITYVPIVVQNQGVAKSLVQVMETEESICGDDIFDVHMAIGNEKMVAKDFIVRDGQNKTLFIKIHGLYRREYDIYIPLKINHLLGPPSKDIASMKEFHTYVGQYEQQYKDNVKVKLRSINKEIAYCRINGVITTPWIEFSTEKFEIDYVPCGDNNLNFTMTNVSKSPFFITIQISKLPPNFTLEFKSSVIDHDFIANENIMKFYVNCGETVELCVVFHPKWHGRFVSTAVFFINSYLNIPYYNLTFIGKRHVPLMTPSTSRVVFLPCQVGKHNMRTITLKTEAECNVDGFRCSSIEEPSVNVEFKDCKTISETGTKCSTVTVNISVFSETAISRDVVINFYHDSGSLCSVELFYCFTHCPITLHAQSCLLKPSDYPYPYYPLKTQTILYEYMETCKEFLEKWMYQQGFRKDLYPVIPNTLLAIATENPSPTPEDNNAKVRGANFSYVNFIKRIAGPLTRLIRQSTAHIEPGPFKHIKETHDNYAEILRLLLSRGVFLGWLQPRFLLSYHQFRIYCNNITPTNNIDIVQNEELLSDAALYNRLNKQCWFDFILQAYKAFIFDSCFFDCVCSNSGPRDMIQILVDWFNAQIVAKHDKLRGKSRQIKKVTNITTDFSDGIAIISAIINHCPFLEDLFSVYCEVAETDGTSGIINNASLIIEAMNLLKLNFPLSSTDLLKPNFLQMLFLAVHLYVTLPMLMPRSTIEFKPPLLRTSVRQVTISPVTQEALTFNYIILHNHKNNFAVEKSATGDNAKKMYLDVRYTANFIKTQKAILLVYGYNKTRIFDTYMIFNLVGSVGALHPLKKSKVSALLYRPMRVDISVISPFNESGIFEVSLTDTEPVEPVMFQEDLKHQFVVKRLSLIDKEIFLTASPKEITALPESCIEHKLFLRLICLSTQTENSWVWFRGSCGEFFIKVITQPRWDMPVDTIQTEVDNWPMDPCNCGEDCECYRTTVLMIPHRNEHMLRALRVALLENASPAMMNIYDSLIGTTMGKIIITMLLADGGTKISEVKHILANDIKYKISSRVLLTRTDRVTFFQHTDEVFSLPVTVPYDNQVERYSLTFTSDCGMDIRLYRVVFNPKERTLMSEDNLCQ